MRICLSILSLALVTCAAAEPPDAPRPNTALLPVPRDAAWLLRHDGFVQVAHHGGVNVLFLGDSITDYWRWRNRGSFTRGRAVWQAYFAPMHAANFGIGSDSIQHVLWRIENGELAGITPKVVVLLIGTNNIGRGGNTTPEIVEGIANLVRQIRSRSPASKLLLLGIFPRGDKDDPARSQIRQVNAGLAALDDGKDIRFLDIGPKFLEPDGALSPEIMPDRLHPNAKGYAIWAEAIQGPLAELMAETEGAAKK